MGDIGMIKGGACLVAQTRRRVVVDVFDHKGTSSGLEVYRRRRGGRKQEIHSKQEHNRITGRARRVLTRCYTLPAKRVNIRECFPEVWHFRTDEPEGDGCRFAMLRARGT